MPDARTQRAPENHPEPEAHAGTRQSRVSHTAHGAEPNREATRAGADKPAAPRGGRGGRARAERGCAAAGGTPPTVGCAPVFKFRACPQCSRKQDTLVARDYL